MHKIEVELDLLGWILSSGCKIDDIINHLSGLLLKLGWGDAPLFGDGYHLIRCTLQNPVPNFVTIFPMCCGRKLGVGPNFFDELGQSLAASRDRCSFAFEQIRRDPRGVNASLGQGFGDDCWLLKFNSKTKVDNWMQKTCRV